MLSQRAALALLILVEAATFGFMSQSVVFPTIIALATVVGLQRTSRIPLTQDRQVILSLAVALLFVVRWRVQPHILSDDHIAHFSPFLHSLGEFLLVLQVAALYIEQPRDVLPITLPWPGVFVMVSAGDIHAQELQRTVFQMASLAFMASAAMYFGASARAAAQQERRSYGIEKAGLAIGTLVATAVAAWAASFALQRYESTLDRLVAELLNQGDATAGGFPSHSRLGSIARRKSERGDDIALRIYAAESPGYLRGKAYHFLETVPGLGRDTMPQTQWEEAPFSPDAHTASTIDVRVLTPTSREGNVSRYVLNDADRVIGNAPTLSIWLDAAQWGTYFLPPHTSELLTNASSLRRDCRWLTSNTDEAAATYTVRLAATSDRSAFFDMSSQSGLYSRSTLLDYPTWIGADPQVKKVVTRVFDDAQSFDDHVEAVEQYFRGNYGYSIGIDVPPGKDPIHGFLVARPNAHCEYFAQAAALLLRMRGIPTRYMTGFVAAERNEYGDYWVARNEHAHAWCEAWDDARGWVVVEATPPAGLPFQSTSAPRHRQLWEYISGFVSEFRYRFAVGGWRWLTQQLVGIVLTPAGVLSVLAVLAAVCVRWRLSARSEEPAISETILELQRLRTRVDRRVAKRGLFRRPGETLIQFATRIDRESGDAAAARWYAEYAAVRYGSAHSAADVAILREKANQLGRLPRGERTSELVPQAQ
jgi:transglutaminase-like putative cysteine protease